MRYLKKLSAMFVMIMAFTALTATVSATGPSPAPTSMSDDRITITGGSNVYKGGDAVGPGAFTVKFDGTVLTQGTDYIVRSLYHTKAGVYQARIIGTGLRFVEERWVTWNLTDGTESKTASIRYQDGKKAFVSATKGLEKDKLLELTGSKGTSYKFKITAPKQSYARFIKTNKKTGRVRIKKGIKPGSYKVKIIVYNRRGKKIGTQTIKITIK